MMRTFFSYGFRPFFLGASLHAALTMLLLQAWLGLQTTGGLDLSQTITGSPHHWHAHEMIFGFGAATLAGFLLTAIPSWTGQAPFSGIPLAGLFGLWLLGRLAFGLSFYVTDEIAAVADLAFLPALVVAALVQLRTQKSPRNLVFAVLLTVLWIANLLFHLEILGVLSNGIELGERIGLYVLISAIAIVAGRIVPAFTRNALVRMGETQRLPKTRPLLDSLSIASIVLFALLDIATDYETAGAIIALVAGTLNALRLAGWRPLSILNQPIVWILHLGYGWLVVGLFIKAFAGLTGAIGDVAALHAFGAGCIGSMTIAVMTRASLGHTGRALAAPTPVTVAYILISVGAVLRIFGPALAPSRYGPLMITAGGCWGLAFALFFVAFTPILFAPVRTEAAAQ